MEFNILSNIIICNYTGEKPLELKLKKDKFLVFKEDGHVFFTLSSLNIRDAEWIFVGEDGYASTGSDFPWLFIKNKSESLEILDKEDFFDKEGLVITNNNLFYYEIPCGNAGGIAVYKTLNQEGEIIGLMLTDIYPDDMDMIDFIFSF